MRWVSLPLDDGSRLLFTICYDGLILLTSSIVIDPLPVRRLNFLLWRRDVGLWGPCCYLLIALLYNWTAVGDFLLRPFSPGAGDISQLGQNILRRLKVLPHTFEIRIDVFIIDTRTLIEKYHKKLIQSFIIELYFFIQNCIGIICKNFKSLCI